MGFDKGAADWGGRRAVDLVAEIAVRAGCGAVFVSGRDYGLPFIADPQPLAGPAAGLAATAAALAAQGFGRALVLAVDAPTVRPEDLAPLLAAPAPGACYEALPAPMVLTLTAVPNGVAANWPLKRLIALAGLAVLPCPEAALTRLRGANTPEERRRLLDDEA
jgi:molybdopterin-guanine dinucleotide biosynthesis protein A